MCKAGSSEKLTERGKLGSCEPKLGSVQHLPNPVHEMLALGDSACLTQD